MHAIAHLEHIPAYGNEDTQTLHLQLLTHDMHSRDALVDSSELRKLQNENIPE